MYFFILIFGR